jgi:hypothetical protein
MSLNPLLDRFNSGHLNEKKHPYEKLHKPLKTIEYKIIK